jgi:glutaredoxin
MVVEVTLYTTGCPQCRVLKQKLDEKGIVYNLETDVSKVIERGFSSAPVLEVDGNMMTFKDAVNWTNQR